MKIILKQDVKGHGKKGDIITVKDGFGMNYLIKNGYGVQADTTEIKKLTKETLKKQEEEQNNIKQAEELKNELAKQELIFVVKTGKTDQVFGSVSPKQIATELTKKGFKIDKKKIMEDIPLSSLGTYQVKIQLHKSVIGTIKVTLKKESR